MTDLDDGLIGSDTDGTGYSMPGAAPRQDPQAADPPTKVSDVAMWIAGKAPVFWNSIEAAELIHKLEALRGAPSQVAPPEPSEEAFEAAKRAHHSGSLRTALREAYRIDGLRSPTAEGPPPSSDMENGEPIRVGGGFWRCDKCGEEYDSSIAHDCRVRP